MDADRKMDGDEQMDRRKNIYAKKRETKTDAYTYQQKGISTF